MGNKLTDEAREELREAIAIVRADKFEVHARTVLGKYKPADADPKPPADPKDPKIPPPRDPADPPAPKKVGLWPVGSTDDND